MHKSYFGSKTYSGSKTQQQKIESGPATGHRKEADASICSDRSRKSFKIKEDIRTFYSCLTEFEVGCLSLQSCDRCLPENFINEVEVGYVASVLKLSPIRNPNINVLTDDLISNL